MICEQVSSQVYLEGQVTREGILNYNAIKCCSQCYRTGIFSAREPKPTCVERVKNAVPANSRSPVISVDNDRGGRWNFKQSLHCNLQTLGLARSTIGRIHFQNLFSISIAHTMDRDFHLIVVLDEQQDNKQNWTTLHQCLLMLFDSPLNHAGLLEVYIRIFKESKIIGLHREVRIPRTFKRFEQLFINFLQGCDMPLVQTKDGPARLFQFINRPLDKILPSNCPRFRVANLTSRVRSPDFFTLPAETNHRAIITVEFGPVDFNFLGSSREAEYEIKAKEQHPAAGTYSISHYPLSSSLMCVKIISAFEKALEVY